MTAAAVQNSQFAGHFQTPVESQYFSVVTTESIETKYKPRDVVTTLYYFKDNEDGSPPAPSYVGKPETYERPSVPEIVTIHDIRGSEDIYTLDKTGFQVVKHESREKDFVDDKNIKGIYYKETEELLKKVTGGSKVFIFDHTIRRQPADSGKKPAGTTVTLRGPVQRVHIDQSYAAGPKRVLHHLPAEADRLLKGRYQIINVWRPIRQIHKDPLAVADSNSVSDDDLVPIKLIYPDREGETLSVRPGNGQHRWHYLGEQRPNEPLLIKCFDSKSDGRARRVPHSAFVDEEFKGAKPRESIEIRALVFHPDDID